LRFHFRFLSFGRIGSGILKSVEHQRAVGGLGHTLLLVLGALSFASCGALFNTLDPASLNTSGGEQDPEIGGDVPANQAPFLSAIAGATTRVNVAVAVGFTISDVDSPLACSGDYLSLRSGNTALVENSAVVFSGSAPDCTATISPSNNQSGSADIRLILSDGALAAETQFSLVVTALVITEASGTSRNNWYSLASDSAGNKLVATVHGGMIHTSSDAGATWVKRTAPGEKNWGKVVSSSDGTRLAATVGSFANHSDTDYIYTSSDSGVTWVAQTGSGQRQWSSIASSADGLKLAATVWSWPGGYLYTSTDAGVTWTAQTAAGTRHWMGLFSSADGTELAGSLWDGDGGGVVIGSFAAGAWTWTARNLGGGNRSAISGSSDFSKLVAGDLSSNRISLSLDGGVTWNNKTLPVGQSAFSAAYSADGSKLVVGTTHSAGGSVYSSSDDGSTWTQELSLNNGPQWGFLVTINSTGNKMTFAQGSGMDPLKQAADTGPRDWRSLTSDVSGTKLAAVVYGGYIYTSTDAGATWTERTSAGAKNWGDIISSADGTRLAAVLHQDEVDYVYTSSDGGATWVSQSGSGSRHWSSIASSADGLKLAATTWTSGTDYLYTSTDGGVTWTQQTAAGSRHWESIVSSPDGTKLAASLWDGDGGLVVLGTYAAGSWTWTVSTPPGGGNRIDICGSADLSVLAVSDGNSSDVAISLDGGVSWNISTLPPGEGGSVSLSCSESGGRIAIGTYNSGGGSVYTSVDHGTTWNRQITRTNGAPESYFNVALNAQGNQLTAAETNGAIYYSGGGSIWTYR